MDLVLEIPNNLDPEFCKKIIDKFDLDERKIQGVTTTGLEIEKKDSLDLPIGWLDDWSEIVSELDIKLNEVIERYIQFIQQRTNLPFDAISLFNLKHHYQVQKINYFDWHHDFSVKPPYMRVFTFMWYLNVPDEGGMTDFIFKKVKPETGKLLVFPASWTCPHKGHFAKNKYILTGWLWVKG
jgi:2OG-Fe(II) oxygenase superfamily